MEFPQIILASQSPRRAQILSAVGMPFVVMPSDVREEGAESGLVPHDLVSVNAKLKAVASDESSADFPTGWVVLGADTIVVCDGLILGKPKDRADATRMLNQLSGRSHEVLTGVHLRDHRKQVRSWVTTSVVHFKNLSPSDVEGYVKTREPFDKAGSYAVQGLGCLWIDRIEGSYTNVMGLPVESLLVELSAMVGCQTFDWFI